MDQEAGMEAQERDLSAAGCEKLLRPRWTMHAKATRW